MRLLVDPIFGPFFAGKLLATTGIWIHNIVAAILAYELSGSTLVVGLVSVAQFGPQLLFAPLSGAMADRGDRRKQLVLGRVVAGIGSAGLAVWIGLVGARGLPGAWPVVLAALVVGIGYVIGGPAMHALLPSLVRREELATAVALSVVPFTIARAAGPALGALVAAAAGPGTAFAIAAAGNFAFAALLSRLRIGARSGNGGGADRRIRAGVRYLAEDRALVLLLVGVVAVGVGADPIVTLTPAMSAGFGSGSTLVGVMASSFGVGAALALIVLGWLRRRLGLPRLGTSGLTLLALSTAGAAVSPQPGLVIVAFGIAGAGMAMAVTGLSTQMQLRLPEGLRGRIMALWSVAFVGSRPVAAAVNGGIADATTPSIALFVVAGVVMTAAWLSRPSRIARRPPPPPQPDTAVE
jgi:MFS family permease